MIRRGVQRQAAAAAAFGVVVAVAAVPVVWAKPPPERLLDLVAQTPAAAASPAVVDMYIEDLDPGTTLRVRLYEPVTTRSDLMASLGAAPTALLDTWTIDGLRPTSTTGGALVSVPVPVPGGGDRRPLPVHIELVSADGVVTDTLRTFLIPPGGAAAGTAVDGLKVAVVIDLRLPPAHTVDGGVEFDRDLLGRVLDLARVLAERPDVPVTVTISPETLDALGLVGDSGSLSALRVALDRRQLLTAPWTALDINGWVDAGRADVVLDGLRRSTETLAWAGFEPSRVMRFEQAPNAAAAAFVTGPAVGMSDLVVPAPQGPRPDHELAHAVAWMADESGGRHRIARADPILGSFLQDRDGELAAQRVLAELVRIAETQAGLEAVVIAAPAVRLGFDFDAVRQAIIPSTEPAALALLLDALAAEPALRPVTVDAMFQAVEPAAASPAGAAEPAVDSIEFGAYLEHRTRAEQRLHAYESLSGSGRSPADALHTILAASASQHLTSYQRTMLLRAVERQAEQHATGVEFAARGGVTITERSASLPVTLINSRPEPLTVALHLSSDTVGFPEGGRTVIRLEPGRNDLSVPILARAAGRSLVAVTVTTPDEAGAIILSSGTQRVRYAAAEGLGFLALVAALSVLAVWWLRALRRRSRSLGAPVLPSLSPATPRSTRADIERESAAGKNPKA